MNTQKIDVWPTGDIPSVPCRTHSISMTALLARIRKVWGDDLSSSFRGLLNELFLGRCYCQENPRELAIDHEFNLIWVFTYAHPKQQDPEGNGLEKYVIELPKELSVFDLMEYQIPIVNYPALEARVGWDLKFAASQLPLLGLPGYGREFCDGNRVAGQTNQHQQHLGQELVHSSVHVVTLSPAASLARDEQLAKWVSQNTFHRHLKGEHVSVVQTYRTMAAYLRQIGVKPNYMASRYNGQINLGMTYTFQPLFKDGVKKVVSGSLFTSSAIRLDRH